ncbi:hypothetical protein C0V70_04285 [Bacteriovorax stolpii]|uniref:Restriction endonuclease type I HsdR N-terminal domain-containing protein n=1 Tax=Bacteriovorax stolpii TaxID=960 RepID=A0A2K9NP96_BACTC|nr:type I restriction endonuclease [Bacteriovorax stolpii]AUN97341.1 hypothetical protein C0V70_04285 [Bacteriovorax stolpii]TDP52513.1 type I restriction and modification enzyme subunit R-like protein [Bacteriovorax stolpii]
MAKENKQDRLVRLMKDNVAEHIMELKALEANPNCKELDIERWVQMVLRSCLGYSATNGYSILAQEQKGKHRPDLVVYKQDKPLFVLEIKKLGFDLNKSDFRCGKVQLQEYLFSLGKIPYGFLCNGYEWKLYDFNNPNGIIEILSFDLRNDEDKLDTSKKFVEDICYDFVDIHEASYTNKEWAEFAKEATAFSPESLSRAILSSNVIKLISKEIRGEHEYKVCSDVLFQKVYDLLANGLDDSLKDFNDVKKAEFQKFIKSQMKASRKGKKKSSSQSNEDCALSNISQSSNENISIQTQLKEDEVA